ncbi:MAG: M15 family metallopeptidase [Nitrospiraceae bacterium]|nr:MAG: M15 family metallopeptidase [Nitrospiraceae bacterium]
MSSEASAKKITVYTASRANPIDDHIRDYLYKMRHFDSPHRDDIWIDRKVYQTFKSTVGRLKRLQEMVGHGNYHILGFDDALGLARHYPIIGEFSRKELDFLEELFYKDAKLYGFLGEKSLLRLTDRIEKGDVTYLAQQGNYLYRGRPLETFNKIRQQVGKTVTLTSGVRGIMKQFLLFLNKAYDNEGNLSLASRSLAPPGYSFHANGDFDVGQAGFGVWNFTDRFTTTDAYHSLCELGYLKLRYEIDNPFGVRFEPWHIRIT